RRGAGPCSRRVPTASSPPSRIVATATGLIPPMGLWFSPSVPLGSATSTRSGTRTWSANTPTSSVGLPKLGRLPTLPAQVCQQPGLIVGVDRWTERRPEHVGSPQRLLAECLG